MLPGQKAGLWWVFGEVILLEVWVLYERFHGLSWYRRRHILRVSAVLEELAEHHGLDEQLSRWAGFGHDLARECTRAELLEEATRLGLEVGPAEQDEPLLLHGPVAAAWLKAAGVANEAVWQAISLHTTAGPRMTDMAKALYIADGVEPGRHFSGRQRLWERAMEDLEAGFRAVLESSVHYAQQRSLPIHRDTQSALDEVIGAVKDSAEG